LRIVSSDEQNMTERTMLASVDESQRKAAILAGLAFPISLACVALVSFTIFFPLNELAAAEMAQRVLAHERLFRIGIVGFLVNCVSLVVLLSAVYVILRPVDQTLALLAAFSRLIQTFTWIVVALNLFSVLRLFTDASFASAFPPGQLPVFARLYLRGMDTYYVGLLFWALAALIGSYLWLKSKYIPAALAAFGAISSAWCVACTLAFYVFPDFANVVNLWWFDSPLVAFELALSGWLLFKGLKPSDNRGLAAKVAAIAR